MSNSSIIQNIIEGYHDILINKRDKRVDDWFMMSSPFPTAIICILYTCFVKIWGPNFMKNRNPYDLRKTIVLYNAGQVILSLWIFIQFGRGGWFGSYSWRCQPVDYSNDIQAVTMLHAVWWFYWSKFTEFLDTIFFVLRKKNENVTFLHVIHHGCMPLTVWLGLKFVPGGHGSLVGLINPLVHSVMYFYYMLAAMGPVCRNYTWWKKYLTYFQMIQFCVTFIHAMQLLFIDCNYPKAFVWWVAYHSVLFLSLFINFFRHDEKRRRERKIALKVVKSKKSELPGQVEGETKLHDGKMDEKVKKESPDKEYIKPSLRRNDIITEIVRNTNPLRQRTKYGN